MYYFFFNISKNMKDMLKKFELLTELYITNFNALNAENIKSYLNLVLIYLI